MQRTSQVPAQHEIKHKETVLIILKSISQVDDERVVNLQVRRLVNYQTIRQEKHILRACHILLRADVALG